MIASAPTANSVGAFQEAVQVERSSPDEINDMRLLGYFALEATKAWEVMAPDLALE
jgi:hypothetical protein